MYAKETKIVLVCSQHNLKQELEITHAERLLRLKNNGGWELPADSKFTFDGNGIKLKPNKKRDSRTAQAEND